MLLVMKTVIALAIFALQNAETICERKCLQENEISIIILEVGILYFNT